jgi:hypothetical protein
MVGDLAPAECASRPVERSVGAEVDPVLTVFLPGAQRHARDAAVHVLRFSRPPGGAHGIERRITAIGASLVRTRLAV